jgi:hypothetical protein
MASVATVPSRTRSRALALSPAIELRQILTNYTAAEKVRATLARSKKDCHGCRRRVNHGLGFRGNAEGAEFNFGGEFPI